MDIAKDIENYIHFLQDNFQLKISVHSFSPKILFNSSLLAFGLHCNEYCMYLKSNDSLWRECILRQKKVFRKAEQGSYFGMCHAGVYEYVYPYHSNQELIGFLCVSGYRIENQNSRTARKRICERFGFSQEVLQECYQSLNRTIPSKSSIDTLLHPLCHMLELYNAQHFISDTEDNNFYNELYHYINCYHNSKITIDDICRHFHCSRSTVSHTFKANNGTSISGYINKLRLNDAKILLKNTHLSIAAISSLVGFSDSNYFSNIFKKSFGDPPLQYRKKIQQKD